MSERDKFVLTWLIVVGIILMGFAVFGAVKDLHLERAIASSTTVEDCLGLQTSFKKYDLNTLCFLEYAQRNYQEDFESKFNTRVELVRQVG
jgi:hypothetical protein